MHKLLFIFVTIILVLSGFYLVFNKKYAGSVEEIKLGVSEFGPQLSALIFIAQDKGYFEDNKLHVTFTVEKGSVAARKNVSDGVQDLGTTSDFGFVGDSFTPTNLRILAVISNTKLIEIIGRKDRGITKPSDLKGKKIAVTLKSSGEFFLGKSLEFNNLKQTDVVIVPTNLDKAEEAITSGKVDVVVTNDPYAYQIKQKLGENAVELPYQINRNNNLLLISNKEVVRSKPAAIERFLASLIQAEEFVKTNPQESKRIIKERFKLEDDYLNQTWPKNNFTISLSQSLLVGMEDEARFMITNKLTDKTIVPNFTDFFYTDALRKVKLEAVTLY